MRTIVVNLPVKKQVDALVPKAIAAGGKPWKPAVEEGSMYGRSFQDLDGHAWDFHAAAN